MGACTVAKIVHETCLVIWEELVNEFMPVPTKEHWEKVSVDYNDKWGFPNCIGSIDGKHCQIKCPKNSGSSHFNYLKYFSLVLQGVADADKKFIIIDVGARGKQSDGGTFASSKLCNLISNNNLNVPPEKHLPGTNIKVPYVLIGDEAYPLKPYLMRPFPSRVLNPAREHFNERLSRARKCIECTFGVLRAKWRLLGKDIEVSPKKAVVIIKCMCLLHNIIREKDGNSDVDYCNVMIDQRNNWENEGMDHPARGANSLQRAKEIRNVYVDYFLNNP
ncbi:protein ALP1-like [Acyrthosiphon pisum]|uniref:DDE Tnp4 domain-containing protein n=1 Tax=Acyrthosiphon pisum TaxID=7029 RepID=A0A8R2BBM5_ACYPI|nr:protein ALP1-like [Acyrthosiphon pisum]|eukprot:XP_008190094.1 PREDICTED: uncharacterized protein LOC103311957 [Acyrthosiphon pisum]